RQGHPRGRRGDHREEPERPDGQRRALLPRRMRAVRVVGPGRYARCGMTIVHPVAVVLDILAEAGVDPARLHDVQRRIAAAYRDANEEIAPTPTREREIREAVLATIREACRCDPYW